ncbi:toll/interleukin-1 receptor domain-containing protein [Sphaerotilaceae bacterium SBD11-9]
MAKVFFSYSHDDEGYRDQLEKHLASLRHEGLIESWHDRRLIAGSNVDAAIDQKINEANVILLLVSASFLDSRYCYSIEMQRALDRHATGEAQVVPVIVRPCDWMSTPLGRLLAVPKDGKPITTWPNFDEAYTDVAKQIRALVQRQSAQSQPGTAALVARIPSEAPATQSVPTTLPRSSNLRLRKEFSELDKDQFLHQSFEFIGRFFENSLHELQARNAGTTGQFRQIDANTFTAAIYQNGRRVSECAVQLGGRGFRDNAITYSADASARGNSFNEQVSVKSDDQEMHLTPLGFGSFGNSPQKLSQEGAAELFWGMLIERLQQ